MPLPSSYTEGTLSAYMESVLGPVGEDLAIGDTDLLTEAVNDLVGLLGAIASVTDLVKLRTLARWKAWEAARVAASRQFDTALSGGKSFKLSQVWAQIQAELVTAATVAASYPEGATALAAAGGGVATVASAGTAGSPYSWAPCDQWGW